MGKILHVFAATDLSATSLHAVDRGFQIAKSTHACYTVMHALGLDALGPLKSLFGEKADEVTRKAAEHQRSVLQQLLDEPGRNQGVAAHLTIEEGLASTVIPAYAATTDADLVLVGAKGQSVWRRLMLGSTASHLLRKSRIPVLVVKNPCTKPYRRVLIALDFSPCSVQAIRVAREVAPTAHLVLLNVFEVPFEGMLQYAGVSQAEIHRYQAEAHQRALRSLHQIANAAGLSQDDYMAIADHGQAVHKILRHETLANCDLIVMGKHGTHVTEELLLGSVTKRVLSESDTDILVVVDRHMP
jgi:nucleotide-binding universal stress UspA family protein